MENTVEKISPTSYGSYASIHTEAWSTLIGITVVHKVWGKCTIEKVDIEKSILYVSGHKVATSFFRDEFFSELEVLSDIAEDVKVYIQEKEELNRKKSEEEEKQKRLQAEEEERLAKEWIEAKRIEREKKYEEAVRMANIREEENQRKLRELENQKRLVAEHELQKRRDAVERAKSIQTFCKQRGVHWLFHFTRLENLKSILENGLLGREQLQKMQLRTRSIVNDEIRLDGFPDAVCLSISFPNYKMFHKLSMKNKGDWVILLLEPYILWEFDCAFFENNAASSSVKNLPLSHRREYSALTKMFDDQPSVKRDHLGILDSYTTNPQAEVLVLEPIPFQYVMSVHFYDSTVMWNWLNNNVKNTKKFVANKEYFSPRMDYTLWQNHNHNSMAQRKDADFLEARR